MSGPSLTMEQVKLTANQNQINIEINEILKKYNASMIGCVLLYEGGHAAIAEYVTINNAPKELVVSLIEKTHISAITALKESLKQY